MEFNSELIAVFGLIVAAGSLLAGVIQAQIQSLHNIRTLRVDHYRNLQDVFAGLSAERERIGRGKVKYKEVESLYREYFARHYEHWQFYKYKVIPKETAINWMCSVFDLMRGWYRIGDFPTQEIWPTIGRRVLRNDMQIIYFFERLYLVAKDYGAHDMSFEDRVIIERKIAKIFKDAIKQKPKKAARCIDKFRQAEIKST